MSYPSLLFSEKAAGRRIAAHVFEDVKLTAFFSEESIGAMRALCCPEDIPVRQDLLRYLDGDGAVMMHLGSLALIGRRAPKNLVHVVVNNGAHETVGGMPVCSGALNITALAEAAGYRRVLKAGTAESLRQALEDAASAEGPVLLEVRCACGARKDLGRPTTTPVQNRDAFMDFLKGG